MTENPENLSYEDRIKLVRKRFICTLAERLDTISSTIREAPEASINEPHARKVHRLFHDMGGNAAMLELSNIERIVRQGVVIAEQVDTSGADLTDAQKTALEAIVAETHAAAAQLREQC
jgi:hypothetical protein